MTELRERLSELLAEAREAGALGQLRDLLGEALREAERVERDAQAASADPAGGGRHGMVGESAPMLRVYELIERVAPSDVSVLVIGETGTGKELVARALHRLSARRAKPFLAENCAAVPAQLLESELFGHKKGSFTGAVADRDGHFVAASGGTLFLDEIGDMPLEMQAKLLRALETKEVRPVGSNRTVRADVRVVAATNRDLATMVAERRFREDLYYRLKVVQIDLPPLRERSGDIERLVGYFLAMVARDNGVAELEIAPEALQALCGHDWPGNVRQLENEIRRLTALCRGRIGLADLSEEVRRAHEAR